MKRKVWNKKERKWTDQKTDNLIVIMKENRITESITIFKNIRFGLRIHPFVEVVKQCYKCYKYGHLKVMCKSVQRCNRYGEESHEECRNEMRCHNCKGDHRSTAKTADFSKGIET